MGTVRHSYRARWVIPVCGEPIENGTVVVEDGLIADVHLAHDPNAVSLGHAAVIPGLVNAHTHLEFSDLGEPIGPPESFPDWIRAVVRHRRERTAAVASVVSRGIRESAASGTTLLAEIATDDVPNSALPDDRPRAVVFRELLGLRDDQIDAQVDIAQRHLRRSPGDDANPQPLRGLSPHAPYSVHPELFAKLVSLAAETRSPLAIHLAETTGERELLARGTGELVEMLRAFGVFSDGVIPRGSRPLDYLTPLAELTSALVVHGNYLDAEEIDFLAGHPHLAVVYCPRTHAYFSHRPHPWRELLHKGASVVLGTDSRASNPDLSVWNELCFLRRRHPEVDPQKLLELATVDAARALGAPRGAGSLVAGAPADLAVFELGTELPADVFSGLLSTCHCVRATMRAGEWIA